jgi:hypothetical protein
MNRHSWITVSFLFCALLSLLGHATADDVDPNPDAAMRSLLDAPLLFTKRHSYSGIHIYDTYYKWPPGGGGICVLENPAAPRDQWRIRPVIDPDTPETLGFGVYDDPELSWDATRILFTFKGEPEGSTSIYEIGVDGRGLRRVSDPECALDCYKGSHGGQHDVYPAYLPDDRVVFLSTRPSGLVPCANSGVAILHVMNPDGTDMHPISVNNVNEFDPAVLPDGRILFGRWEYVDKNALTIQSLWSMNPDGTQETAVYANNMVFPESVLDARPVPDTHLIVGTFAKHNSTPRGSIALVDPRLGKNDPKAIENLEHPENPTCDTGESCEPWPVTSDVFLYSGRAQGDQRSSIRMIDRNGRQITLLSDPEICLHSPMLVKPRRRPNAIADVVDRSAPTGRFFLQDIYQGLTGVQRGEVKHLRVIEETSRVSPTTMGGSPYNQTFLVSAALAFGAKNYLGIVPVAEDGSAYFEVPSGRAVYLQALDAEGRLVQSMRTFVQASPGTTRSCIGCHEHKYSTSSSAADLANLVGRQPDRLQPESWGSGYVDFPSRVQPVLDKHCVRCHGGPEGIAAGMDLSGGWTEHFSISYENLANRRETQLIAYWIAGIDCMNGTAPWSAQIFAPRQHGSGAAPLADLLVEGHEGYMPDMTRTERDLLMAWIDSNRNAEGRLPGVSRRRRQDHLHRERLDQPATSRVEPHSSRTTVERQRRIRPGHLPRSQDRPPPPADPPALERLCPRGPAARGIPKKRSASARSERRTHRQLCLDARRTLPEDAGDHPRRPRRGPGRSAGGHAGGRGDCRNVSHVSSTARASLCPGADREVRSRRCGPGFVGGVGCHDRTGSRGSPSLPAALCA